MRQDDACIINRNNYNLFITLDLLRLSPYSVKWHFTIWHLICSHMFVNHKLVHRSFHCLSFVFVCLFFFTERKPLNVKNVTYSFYRYSIFEGLFDVQNTVSTTPTIVIQLNTNVQITFDVLFAPFTIFTVFLGFFMDS